LVSFGSGLYSADARRELSAAGKSALITRT
jgi:hypothetical protein